MVTGRNRHDSAFQPIDLNGPYQIDELGITEWFGEISVGAHFIALADVFT
jgi:hypothetical protein